MAKYETKRVNMNLPTKLVERVNDYADKLGVPNTQAFIFLINYGFQYADLEDNLRRLEKLVSDIKDSNIETLA